MKEKIKRIEALLKINILTGLKNEKQILKLYYDIIKSGYPEPLLKAKLQIIKNNFLEEKKINNYLKGTKTLTIEDIKFRNDIKKLQELGFDYFM